MVNNRLTSPTKTDLRAETLAPKYHQNSPNMREICMKSRENDEK